MTLTHLAIGFLVAIALVIGVIAFTANPSGSVQKDIYVFSGVSPVVPGISITVSREQTINNTVLFSISNNSETSITVLFYDKAILENGQTAKAGVQGDYERKVFPGATENIMVCFDNVRYPVSWYVPYDILTSSGAYECRMNFAWLPR